MKHFLQLALRTLFALLVTLASMSLSARASDFKQSHVDILVSEMQNLRYYEDSDPDSHVVYENTFEMLMAFFSKTTTDCGKKTLKSCAKDILKSTAKAAYEAKRIDKIEYLNLKIIGHSIIEADGELAFKDDEDRRRRFREKYLVPLSEYLRIKNYYSYRRIDAGVDRELEQDLLDVMRTNYRRKIKRVGRVNTAEYLLANFSRVQINDMAEVMMTTIQIMTSGEGFLTFSRKNYKEIYGRIDVLDHEILRLVNAIVNAEDDEAESARLAKEIETKRAEIIELRKSLIAENLVKEIETLKTELGDLAIELAKTADQAKREELNAAIESKKQKLEESKEALDKEFIRIKLAAPDIMNAARNYLEIKLDDLHKSGTLKSNRVRAEIGDLVTAIYVRGDIDSRTLHALFTISMLEEPFEAVYKKLLKVTWDVGRVVLMSYPLTMPAALLGTLVYSSIQQRKAYEKQLATKSQYVR